MSFPLTTSSVQIKLSLTVSYKNAVSTAKQSRISMSGGYIIHKTSWRILLRALTTVTYWWGELFCACSHGHTPLVARLNCSATNVHFVWKPPNTSQSKMVKSRLLWTDLVQCKAFGLKVVVKYVSNNKQIIHSFKCTLRAVRKRPGIKCKLILFILRSHSPSLQVAYI